jgi:hypothetical protein
MTDFQKIKFLDRLSKGELNVEQYDPEDVWEEQQWEIQEIGQIPYGDGDIGVCANWWGATLIEAITEWSKDQ